MMLGLGGSIIWFLAFMGPNILIQIIKFSVWYLVYTLGAIALKILWKLRYEVFNQDLKYKRAECENRIVIVTGATSGIGLAAANHFYTEGFVVVACYYSRDEPGYKELELLTQVNAPNSSYSSMYLIELNVKSTESIEICYKKVKAVMAERPELQLHALVNVAGVGCFHKFQWLLRDQIKNMIETNLLGPILMTRQFLHLLIENPGSRIINVASPMAYLPTEYNSVYGATKAGLTQFTNALEVDTMCYGVKTVTVHPGNLLKNTSILNSSIETKLERIIPELNDDEKRIYKIELDKHKQRLESVKRAFNRSTSMKLSHRATLISNLKKLSVIVSGAVEGTRLDLNESFMLSFDNSVKLKDPPKEMFAGNMFFSIVIGSLLEWTSRAFFRDAFLITKRNGIDLFNFV